MLLIATVVFGLVVLGLAVVAWVVQLAMRRLRLEPMSVLVFFGLAETVPDELSARRAAPVAGVAITRVSRSS